MDRVRSRVWELMECGDMRAHEKIGFDKSRATSSCLMRINNEIHKSADMGVEGISAWWLFPCDIGVFVGFVDDPKISKCAKILYNHARLCIHAQD